MKSLESRAFFSLLANDKGQAVLEGVLSVVALLVLMLACFLLLAWGNNLQHAHMGARVLAFRATEQKVAWSRNPGKTKAEEVRADTAGEHGSAGWTRTDPDGKGNWAKPKHLQSVMLSRFNSEQSGAVQDRVQGKVFIQDKGRTELGFAASYAGGSDPWRVNRVWADSTFFLAAWGVGRGQTRVSDLSGAPSWPFAPDPAFDLVKQAIGIGVP